jgi:hypothetical protein
MHLDQISVGIFEHQVELLLVLSDFRADHWGLVLWDGTDQIVKLMPGAKFDTQAECGAVTFAAGFFNQEQVELRGRKLLTRSVRIAGYGSTFEPEVTAVKVCHGPELGGIEFVKDDPNRANIFHSID